MRTRGGPWSQMCRIESPLMLRNKNNAQKRNKTTTFRVFLFISVFVVYVFSLYLSILTKQRQFLPQPLL